MNDIIPIERRKLSDSVQERLLAMIQGGQIGPDEFLPSERELMASFAVGRPAIREALQNLHRMGLVEIRHGERARVALPSFGRMVDQMSDTVRHLLTHSPASLEHLKEARATFEMEIARIAARRRKDADVKRLRNILATQADFANDPAKFLEWDGKLHREIAVISGNPIFVSVNESMFRWLSHFHVDLVRSLGEEKMTIAEHGQLVDAIARGDADAAAKAMGDHLTRANRLYRQTKKKGKAV